MITEMVFNPREAKSLIEREIMLRSIEDVKSFVSITMSHPYDTEITSGKYTVNAKSIMGIFSVDLTKPLHVIAHCEEDDGIAAQIEPYVYVAEKK